MLHALMRYCRNMFIHALTSIIKILHVVDGNIVNFHPMKTIVNQGIGIFALL